MWFFILSGFIACTGKPVSSSCSVEISPPRAVVSIGDRFSANCSTSSDQVEQMGWESSNGKALVLPGVSSLPLNIDSVSDWRLEPICFINLKNYDKCSQTLPVTVYKTPDSVSTSQIGPVTEGENYSMQCDIVNVAPIGSLSVQWHMGNDIFHIETFDEISFYPVNRSSVCNLTAFRDNNGAEIWCEARLSFGTSGPNLPPVKSQPQEVIVLYPPTFVSPARETLELQAGSEVILNCTATGNPMPVYSWHFPNPLQLTENQSSNQSIVALSFEHPGTYNCTASNSQGTRTKHFTIIEVPRDRTTFAVLVGGFVSLGVILFIVGLFFVTRDGSFAFSNGSYAVGHPTLSGPV